MTKRFTVSIADNCALLAEGGLNLTELTSILYQLPRDAKFVGFNTGVCTQGEFGAERTGEFPCVKVVYLFFTTAAATISENGIYQVERRTGFGLVERKSK